MPALLEPRSGSQGGSADPTPSSPGNEITGLASLTAEDGSRLITNLVSADGQYNYQMCKFLLRENKANVTTLTPRWVGYGEPTPGYPVSLSIWDFTASSWEQLASSQLSTEGTLMLAKSSPSRYIGTGGEVYLMAKARHDGNKPVVLTGPTVSNFSSSGATITWTTGEPATSYVDYGFTTNTPPATTPSTPPTRRPRLP